MGRALVIRTSIQIGVGRSRREFPPAESDLYDLVGMVLMVLQGEASRHQGGDGREYGLSEKGGVSRYRIWMDLVVCICIACFLSIFQLD